MGRNVRYDQGSDCRSSAWPVSVGLGTVDPPEKKGQFTQSESLVNEAVSAVRHLTTSMEKPILSIKRRCQDAAILETCSSPLPAGDV